MFLCIPIDPSGKHTIISVDRFACIKYKEIIMELYTNISQADVTLTLGSIG